MRAARSPPPLLQFLQLHTHVSATTCSIEIDSPLRGGNGSGSRSPAGNEWPTHGSSLRPPLLTSILYHLPCPTFPFLPGPFSHNQVQFFRFRSHNASTLSPQIQRKSPVPTVVTNTRETRTRNANSSHSAQATNVPKRCES